MPEDEIRVNSGPSGYALRIFVSHSSENVDLALSLKRLLEREGIDVFVAHEDLEPSVEWQEEILNALLVSDIFIPILTPEFRLSKWCDQETGIAVSRGSFIVPLNCGLNPYGFIARYQALRCGNGITSVTADQILDALNRKEEFRSRIINSSVRALQQSRSYAESRKIIGNLRALRLLRADLNGICSAWLQNNQVRDEVVSTGFIKNLLRDRGSEIDPQLRSEVAGTLMEMEDEQPPNYR